MQDFFVHFKLRVFVYVTTITFYAELNAYLDVSLSAKLCLNLPGSLIGPSINALATISLTPNVRVSPEGGVYISVLVIAVTFVIKYIIFSLQVERVGISITGSFNYQLQPTGTAELSGTSLSRACSLTHSLTYSLTQSLTHSINQSINLIPLSQKHHSGYVVYHAGSRHSTHCTRTIEPHVRVPHLYTVLMVAVVLQEVHKTCGSW